MSAIPSNVGIADKTIEQEFAEAVRLHQSMVFSIAFHYVRDRALAEELAQEVFLQLHRNWCSIKSPEHLVFWLRKVTSHRCIDWSRSRKAASEISLDDAAEPTALESIQDPLLSAWLERMVASLPEKQRLLIILRFQEGMEPEEIAKALGMNVSTVKSQVQRTIELLRSKAARTMERKE